MLQAAANANQAALITIPINGYVAADESGPVNPSIPPSQSPHFVPEYPTPSADPNPAANHVYQNQFIQWVTASDVNQSDSLDFGREVLLFDRWLSPRRGIPVTSLGRSGPPDRRGFATVVDPTDADFGRSTRLVPGWENNQSSSPSSYHGFRSHSLSLFAAVPYWPRW